MSRLVVRKAVEFKCPKRVPFLHWIDGRTFEKYGLALTDFLKDFPEDICQLSPRAPANWRPPQDGCDEWGCIRQSVGGFGSRIEQHPLEDWEAFSGYVLPDPYAPGRFAGALERMNAFPGRYFLGTVPNTIFERMHFLHGFENTLQDFHIDRKRIEELAERTVEYDAGLIRGWTELGVDGVFFMDDYGLQQQLVMSPQHFREIFKPAYRQLIELCHKHGLHTFLHTCGNVREIIPDLIEIGLDVLQGVQPHAMNIEEIGKQFRGHICFMGGLDAQQILPFGTPEDVRQMVQGCIQHLGTAKGGYIGSPSTEILPDTPLENIKMVFRSWRELDYPK